RRRHALERRRRRDLFWVVAPTPCRAANVERTRRAFARGDRNVGALSARRGRLEALRECSVADLTGRSLAPAIRLALIRQRTAEARPERERCGDGDGRATARTSRIAASGGENREGRNDTLHVFRSGESTPSDGPRKSSPIVSS